MLNQKLLYISNILLAITILSCNKSTESGSTIIGKWTVDSIQVIGGSYTSNPFFTTLYRNQGNDYSYNFTTDGKVYRARNASRDTIQSYTIIKPEMGKAYIKYYPLPTNPDTIQSISSSKMILITPEGGKSLMYFSR